MVPRVAEQLAVWLGSVSAVAPFGSPSPPSPTFPSTPKSSCPSSPSSSSPGPCTANAAAAPSGPVAVVEELLNLLHGMMVVSAASRNEAFARPLCLEALVRAAASSASYAAALGCLELLAVSSEKRAPLVVAALAAQLSLNTTPPFGTTDNGSSIGDVDDTSANPDRPEAARAEQLEWLLVNRSCMLATMATILRRSSTPVLSVARDGLAALLQLWIFACSCAPIKVC